MRKTVLSLLMLVALAAAEEATTDSTTSLPSNEQATTAIAPATAPSAPSTPGPLVAPPRKTAAKNERLSTTGENVFEAVDILGDGLLFSPIIWGDMLRLNEADRVVQEQIEEKKFANDPYFMRNIDREEFEEERLLLLFEDRARLYEKYLTEMRQQLNSDSSSAEQTVEER